MKIKKFVFAACTLLLSASSLHAYDDNCEPKPICEPEPPCCDVPEAPCTTAYNHPGRVDVCGSWDMFITGSFIYWQPYEEEMSVATYYDAIGAANLSLIQRNYMDFDFKPGFKVGIGYNFEHDNWTGYVEYTRFHSTHNNTFSMPSWVEYINYNWFDNSFYSSSSPADFRTKLKIDLDIIDLELSRWEYRGKNLIFNPFCGLKGGWLDQSMTAWFVEPSDYIPTNTKSDSWLIGPRTGFYAHWLLGEGFSFFDKTALTLAYQKMHNLKEAFASTYSVDNITNITSDDHHHVIPILEIMLGMNWGGYFDRNNYHFDISAAYELQYFWSQNYVAYIDTVEHGDLSFHGLNITARIDF